MKTCLTICLLFAMFYGTSQEGKDDAIIEHADYKRAIEFYNAATEDYDMENFSSAVENFRKAATLNPNSSDYPYGLASSFYELKKYDSAIKYIEFAIALEPKQPDYHYRAGNIYFKARRFSEARENYTIALDNLSEEVVINEINCRFNRGVSAFYLKKYTSAIKDFDRVIKENEENDYAYHMRGVSYLRLKQNDSACQDLRKAHELGNATSMQYIEKSCQ